MGKRSLSNGLWGRTGHLTGSHSLARYPLGWDRAFWLAFLWNLGTDELAEPGGGGNPQRLPDRWPRRYGCAAALPTARGSLGEDGYRRHGPSLHAISGEPK